MVRPGRAGGGNVRRATARQGTPWPGSARQAVAGAGARPGRVGLGRAWLGQAWQGSAHLGMAPLALAWRALAGPWRPSDGPGQASGGEAWLAMARLPAPWRPLAPHAVAPEGKARIGYPRHGTASFGLARGAMAGLGGLRSAWQCKAGPGGARRGNARTRARRDAARRLLGRAGSGLASQGAAWLCAAPHRTARLGRGGRS
jgi:hypothetical protein